MFPIPGFEQIKIAWFEIQQQGYLLYGFLLYTASDRVLADFMKDGIYDLDVLSGDQCVIFVIESPSKEWIQYTKTSNHSWWKIVGKDVIQQSLKQYSEQIRENFLLIKDLIPYSPNLSFSIGNEDTVTLDQIINPPINIPYNRAEAYKIAKHFGVNISEIPCLIFFKDLDSTDIYKAPIALNNCKTQDEVKITFREFFGKDFLEIEEIRSLFQRNPYGKNY